MAGRIAGRESAGGAVSPSVENRVHSASYKYSFLMQNLVHDVARMRSMIVDSFLAPHGVTRSQWAVLGNIVRLDRGPLNQVDIAKLLGITKASVGPLLRRLESSGFITRSNSPTDARAILITLTDLGRQKAEEMVTVGQPLNERMLDGISTRDLDAALRVLKKMKKNIQNEISVDDIAIPRAEPLRSWDTL